MGFCCCFNDDDDDDDAAATAAAAVLYSAVRPTPCYCSMLGALGRVENL